MPTVTLYLAGLDQVKAGFRGIRDDQLPFATVQALTWTAKDVQAVERDVVLPGRFVLRAAAWMKANIRTKPATKTDLRAAVVDNYTAMLLQESGGIKTRYGGFLAIPTNVLRPPGSRKLITPHSNPQLMPEAIMQNGGFIRDGIMYAVALKRGRGGGLRAGKLGALSGIQRQASWERKILPMYVLVRSANIPRRYGFVDQARKTIAERFAPNFAKGFRRAVRTAR